MNEIRYKHLLAGAKFTLKMHWRQPKSPDSACRLLLTKNKEITQKFKETGGSRCIYQNELDKACFQHVMAYRDCMDFPRGRPFDNLFLDKAFDIAKISKYDMNKNILYDYFVNIIWIFKKWISKKSYFNKFFDKNSSSVNTSDGGIKNENMSHQELAEELLLHKPTIKKFEKRKVHSSFINNIWVADLSNMQIISIFNKGICF